MRVPGRIVDEEEPLVDVVDNEGAGKLRLLLAEVAGVRTPCVIARLSENVGRGRLRECSVLVEAKDLDPAVAVTGDKESSMDAIQRRLRRSPHAVARGPSVGNPAHERRVAPDVFLSELIAGRLAVSLRDGDSRYEHRGAHAEPSRRTPCVHWNLLAFLEAMQYRIPASVSSCLAVDTPCTSTPRSTLGICFLAQQDPEGTLEHGEWEDEDQRVAAVEQVRREHAPPNVSEMHGEPLHHSVRCL